MSVNLSEGAFEGAGGTRLFKRSWLPAQSPKATLVVVHGLKEHSGWYDGVARKWAEAGYAVHAFDLRGHGRSEGRRAFVRSFDEFVDDLTIFTTRVREREGARPLFVFGHSIGGAITTLFALSKKQDLRGFVLSAPALKVTTGVTPGRIRVVRFLSKVFPTAGVYKIPNADFSRDPKVVEEMNRDPLIYQKLLPARTAAELIGAQARIREGAPNLTVPFLVMHGTADQLTNPDGSRELHQRASSVDKTLKLYEGLVHNLLREPEGAKVFQDVFGWLEAHATRS